MSQTIEQNLKRKCETTEEEKRIKIAADNLPAHINYWLNETTPDCYFKVGSEAGPVERIGALKLFLSAHSEPLRIMFTQNYKEGQDGEVRIVDVEIETFKTLLKCICGGCDVVIPSLTMEESVKLLEVADKYLVEYVKNKVLSYIRKILNCKNIFTALECSSCLEDPDTSQIMVSTVQNNTEDIIFDKQFLALSANALFWILQQTNLNTEEIEIWKAVLKWAKRKSNSRDGKTLRKYMYPFLNHIRFLTMDLKELWKHIEPAKVLLLEEIVDISRSLCTRIPHDMTHICRAMRPRQMHLLSDKLTVLSINYMTYVDVFCAIKNCDDLKWLEESELFSWSGFHWRISVGRRNDFGNETFAVYVSCYGNFEKQQKREVRVMTIATLMDDEANRQHSRTFYGNFTKKTPSSGMSNFCEWSKMEQTFIRHNEAKLTLIIALI
ncbi:uncharacterized protein LOC128989546 [Macrosteles quadrilineatus]|uniref:uncharacterized protein LOC128989546 n=1 Tax=Macrosteles quadrilineatus TaxID=74068 RepID=UPI0023E1C69E|nr:uncharacterized protein LOC128989546 [Macrosteles quadrilineatus]